MYKSYTKTINLYKLIFLVPGRVVHSIFLIFVIVEFGSGEG